MHSFESSGLKLVSVISSTGDKAHSIC
uniref:Uncharacterized protein n=1 Tax=Rhizophora mucronata TaxID=61149 RepID=A0A2P2P178_RHIMU